MTRIFLTPEQLTSDEILITGNNARHLSLVLRMKAGESFEALDGEGYKYRCTVKTSHKKAVVAEIKHKEPCSVESPIFITLAQGMARGEKMDLIIQKSTELGVQEIIPVITERSQIRNTTKLERWKKIATSAAQQSGRDKIPEISDPLHLNEFLNNQITSSTHSMKSEKGLLKLILSESYKEQNMKDILKSDQSREHIFLLIGPEGGFSKEEVSAAVEKDFTEVSLGPRILRTETAPLAALSIIQYELGDMG